MDFEGLAYDPLLDPTNIDLPTDFTTTSTTANSDNGNSRKRSPSTTPTPTSKRSKPTTTTTVSYANRLKDPATRNTALNELLQASSTNVGFNLEGEDVLQELASIVYQILDWNWNEHTNAQEPKFLPWEYPNQEAKNYAQHCRDAFSNKTTLMPPENRRTIEIVLVILRNLSYAAANVRLIAFSPNILAILIGALYQETFSTSPSSIDDSSTSPPDLLATSALQTLVNLAPHLDVTGQKLFCDKLFFAPKNDEGPLLPNPSSFGLAAEGAWGFGSLWLAKRLDAKEDVITDIPNPTLLQLTNAQDYLIQVWAIFPALAFILNDPKSSRTVLMTAVDLLQEFVNHARVGVVGAIDKQTQTDINIIPTARAVLVNMPDSVLLRITELLYAPRLGPDSLSYEDPTINIVTRVNMFKLMTGYDATVDTDVRDRALDILVPLLELDSPRMALRVAVGMDPNNNNNNKRIRTSFFDALVPVLAGQAGRNESSMLASQLLKELAKAGKETKAGLGYIQNRLIELATKDPRISQLAVAHLYRVEHEKEDEGDGDGDDEEREEEV